MSLAIASFALVAILGLVAVSQRSAKDSSDDTRLSQIARQVFQQAQIDLATDAAFNMGLNTYPVLTGWTAVTVNSQTEYQRQYWFDDQGVKLSTQTGATFYTATVNLGNLYSLTQTPPQPPNTDTTMLKALVIKITWPPGATPGTGPSRTYSMLLRNRGSYGNGSIYTPPYP